jgi:two-component system, sensor histidine kinase PdtaS
MSPEDNSHFTRCGLPGIDRVAYGMHACHFYSNREELLAALAPYFIAGLRANERCLWITAPPLPSHEAAQALCAVWDGADDVIQTGALRVLDFDHWYTNSAGLGGLDVLPFWLREEERALADGYSGLRITGNTSFLPPDAWSKFMEYEQAVTGHFRGRRIVTLCSYSLEHCDDQQVHEVMQSHHCTFERPDTDWRVVADRDRTGDILRQPQEVLDGREARKISIHKHQRGTR